MASILKIIEALTKLAPHSEKLVTLILAVAVLAAIIFHGMHGGSL